MSSISKVAPRFIIKIKSERLKRENWDLKLSIKEARENGELISLNDSQVLRWLDELNELENVDDKVAELKKELKKLKSNPNLKATKEDIAKKSNELDSLLYKDDYVCVVMNKQKISEYEHIKDKGFKINDIHYSRLLGTTGGVKNNTIVFVNSKHIETIRNRINNGRDLNKEFSPAKLEAYKALVCSASTPLSMPKGICVVHDCVTHFKDSVIILDDTNVNEPKMVYKEQEDIEVIDSDGYGLGMPSLMERWGKELGLDYIIPGCVIRNSFCKGAVFCVDFQKYAADNGYKYIQDVWGTWHHVKNIELILTESMVKLWDSYHSIYMYLYNCKKNKYTFSITKASELDLENERNSNYQFIQPYTNMSDKDINELIAPTVKEIKDITSGDYRKMILYTKGVGLTEKNVKHLDSSPMTALMIDKRMKDDPFIQSTIDKMISKRINEAKVGTLKIPANYSLVCGDPYSLCQSMFKDKVTGLLKAGEVYSKYWVEKNVKKISCFRAPMTSHNNIRLMNVVHNEKMDEFYKYLTTPTLFNSWDTCDRALNGMDKDGDCVINTSMDVIVRNTKQLPAITCVQRKAPKCVPTEDDFYKSNINSFGNDVGSTTNKITSMFEVQSQFEEGSREFNILQYRIMCGQLYQQNAIDKTKGIDAKPMPKEWSEWNSNRIIKQDKNGNYYIADIPNKEKKKRVFNRGIIAENKPYFMRYIYPKCNNEYKKYVRDTEEKCKINFDMSISELEAYVSENLTEKNKLNKETKFLNYYYKHFPLGMNPCIINKICWKFEKEFDEKAKKYNDDFDCSILKNPEVSYSKELYKRLEKIYKNYKTTVAAYQQKSKKERIKSSDNRIQRYIMREDFRNECEKVCPNENCLTNILVDMCYKSNTSKQFVWDMCGSVIIQNLLKLNNYVIEYPTKDKDGDIVFNGERFKMVSCKIDQEIQIEDEDENIQEEEE